MSDVSRPGAQHGADATHEWNAASYHRVSNPHVAWGERVLARVPLRGDETVLDAGCGTGRLTERLLKRLPRGQVIAVDRSAHMLELAAEHLSPRFADRVRFLQADLMQLDLDEAVDIVFSTATFHWVLDHDLLFRTLYRVLKPGGRLVAQCGGGPVLAHVLQRAARLMATPPFAPLFAGWGKQWEFAGPETTAHRLQTAGFVAVKTWLERTPVTLDGPEEYAEYVRTVVFRPHVTQIGDEALGTRFIDELTAAAAEDAPPYSLDYWRLNVEGRRPE